MVSSPLHASFFYRDLLRIGSRLLIADRIDRLFDVLFQLKRFFDQMIDQGYNVDLKYLAKELKIKEIKKSRFSKFFSERVIRFKASLFSVFFRRKKTHCLESRVKRAWQTCFMLLKVWSYGKMLAGVRRDSRKLIGFSSRGGLSYRTSTRAKANIYSTICTFTPPTS